jgi:APA family basic amino acid/polyamine antiporter
MALGLMSTVSAMVTIGPRLYYAMAKNGAFVQVAARIDERTNTPVIAIICQGACAMLMTFTPFPDLMTYIGVTLNFFACMSVASLFIFRRRADWQRLPAVSFAWPLVPGTFILVGIWMTAYGFTLQPIVSLCAVLTIGLGALVYHLRVKSHDRNSTATAPGRI